jgi:AcrR family transcriptional regulator
MARTAGARNTQYDDRRNALIIKARERLELQSGSAPSFRELALAAGVSVATLRHYFGSRDDLIRSVFAYYLLGAERHLARASQTESGDLAAELTFVMQRIVIGWTRGNVGALHRIGLSEGLRNPATALYYLMDVLEPTLQALERRLEGYRALGVIRADTLPRHASLALLSPLVLALLHQFDLGGTRCRPLSIDDLIEQHVAMFVRAYRR